jgi:hypothetical protein
MALCVEHCLNWRPKAHPHQRISWARAGRHQAIHPHFWLLTRYSSSTMPKHKKRLRGKPRRGSPWRPRRPLAPPPAQPPVDTPTHHRELVPHSLSSALREIQSLSMVALSHPNPPVPPGPYAAQNPPLSSDQPHQAHSSADDIHGERLIDKLAILQGLVFDLRQGVEDLQFRLELNNERIGLFL